MPVDFYYTRASAPCRTVELTASVVGVPLNLIQLDLMKQEHLTPKFLKLNPQHTVPTIVDNGVVLWESAAIISYLAQKYSKNEFLYPKELKKKALVDQRLYFNAGTIYTHMGNYFYPIIFEGLEPVPAKLSKLKDGFNFFNIFLEDQEFAAGNCFTVADIALVATVSTCDALNFDIRPYKNVFNWYNKIKKLIPGYEAISGKDTLVKAFEEFTNK